MSVARTRLALVIASSSVLLASLAVHASSSASRVQQRVHIDDVTLLEPGAGGWKERSAVDLLLEDGRISRIGASLPIDLDKGEVRLRGQGRWLVPAPRVSLSSPNARPTDLLAAGLSGIGGVMLETDPATARAFFARAHLDAEALPLQLPPGSDVEGHLTYTSRQVPTLALLAASVGGPEQLFAALGTRSDAPFAEGKEAAFLLLSRDPRIDPGALLDPHVVILGDGYILQSERLVRIEEAIAGITVRAPSFEPEDRTSGTSSESLMYRHVIDGIVRGITVLDIERRGGEIIGARLRERTAKPVAGTMVAEVQWPDRASTLEQVTEGISIKAGTRTDGSQLEVRINDAPVPESPVSLEPGDRFVPHTLLVLLDAMRVTEEGSGRWVQLDRDAAGVPMLVWSSRKPIRPMEPGQDALLSQEMLKALGGPLARSFVTLASGADDRDSCLAVLGKGGTPLLLLVHTPWGVVSWSLEGSGP